MEKNKKQNFTHTEVPEDIQLKDALQSPPQKDLSIIDDSNNHSVINLVHPSFRPKITNIPTEYLDMSLEDLKKELNPTVTHYRLRYMFWNEYECAVEHGKMMRLTRIYSGVCSEGYFATLTKNPLFMAFLVSPPMDYVSVVKESLQAGMENLRRIVSANVFDEDGNLIPRAADVVIKGIALLDLRVKGAVIQRIDQRLVSLNVNKEVTEMNNPDAELNLPNSLEQLNAEIEKVKQQLLAEPIRGVKTITDLANYTQEKIDQNFFKGTKTKPLIANYRKK
jgi:HPt (histidine-containing phosphotransfer) domain-containing protein